MKENYFNIIDTKEKAYWLGFLYADGYMETRNQKPYRLGIQIRKDDEILIHILNNIEKEIIQLL